MRNRIKRDRIECDLIEVILKLCFLYIFSEAFIQLNKIGNELSTSYMKIAAPLNLCEWLKYIHLCFCKPMN